MKVARLLLTEAFKIVMLTSAFQHTSSVIAKAKAETWQVTWSSHLNLTLNLCTLFFVLLLAFLSHLPPPKFPNCSSPSESVSVFAGYLRFHFSVSQSKALRSRARGYFSELCKPHAWRSLIHPFALTFFLLNFLRLPQISRPPPLAQITLPVPC